MSIRHAWYARSYLASMLCKTEIRNPDLSYFGIIEKGTLHQWRVATSRQQRQWSRSDVNWIPMTVRTCTLVAPYQSLVE